MQTERARIIKEDIEVKIAAVRPDFVHCVKFGATLFLQSKKVMMTLASHRTNMPLEDSMGNS